MSSYALIRLQVDKEHCLNVFKVMVVGGGGMQATTETVPNFHLMELCYDLVNINKSARNVSDFPFRWGECRLHSSSTCKVETEEQRCLTVSGPRAGSVDPSDDILPRTFNILLLGTPCIFPFVYSGKVYNQCAEWVHGGENEGKFWCSTK